MCAFTSPFDRARAGFSPGRVDALVWSLTDLVLQPMASAGIFELYRRRHEQREAEQRNKLQPTRSEPQPGSMEWFEAQKKKT